MRLPVDVVLAAVAHAPDAVVIVDAAATICYWNDGAARIFGYEQDAMVGSTLDARRDHPPTTASTPPRGVQRRDGPGLDTLRRSRPPGRARPPRGWGTISIEFSVVLLQTGGGSVGHVAAIIRDVTGRRARELELRRRIEAFEGSRQAP